ncbi:hypothetical protein LJR257_006773 [Ensifer adhaerens]
MKYYEAFGEGGFHTAFMTTYSFGTLAFEDIPFPKLRGGGCRNIVVFADRAMVNQAFADFGLPRFAGTSYHLIKAKAPRAFHPKITLLIGENKGRLLIGSANLTALGLGGNMEQVASISYSEENPGTASLFKGVLGYLERYVPGDDPWFSFSLERAKRAAPWLRDDGAEPTFQSQGTEELNVLFDRPELSILQQIRLSISNDTIHRLVIVSPYWDNQLEGLSRLRSALGDPETHILIDPANGFPASAFPKISDVSLFDISASGGKRFFHAKLIIALGESWDHVISGSINCTYPALMGPAANGNAEAGIYKRAARGTALASLGLENYQDKKLRAEDVAQLQVPLTEQSAQDTSVDGGTLKLQSGTLMWKAPLKVVSEPELIRLFDNENAPLPIVQLNGKLIAAYTIATEQRPKHGEIVFADGSVSAPMAVTDLDALATNTLPPKRGKKKRLSDFLAEAEIESLDMYECLNDLEEIEDGDLAQQLSQIPKRKQQNAESAAPEYRTLTYEEFVRARTQANASATNFGLYLNSPRDKAANILSICLNKMIGLVGVDLAALEDQAIESQNAIDLRSQEPVSPEEVNDDPHSKKPDVVAPSTAAVNLATAKKFQEAVDAFTRRCKSLAGKSITTSEMVRIRALIQIILAHAHPISGKPTDSQILPVYKIDGHDWPRLIGRLLLLHFGTARALQNLTVEPDEAEQQRVVEYLALANWAAQAAFQAVKSEKNATVLLTPLQRLIGDLKLQTSAILAAVPEDRTYFEQITAKVDERFASRLGIKTAN